MIALVQRLWAGEVPLGRVFWDYGMIGGTVLNALVTVLAMALLTLDGLLEALALAVFFLPLPYNLLIVVAVWRSASAYPGPRRWADLARILILFWAAAATAL